MPVGEGPGALVPAALFVCLLLPCGANSQAAYTAAQLNRLRGVGGPPTLTLTKTYFYFGERAWITCTSMASVPVAVNIKTDCSACPITSSVQTPDQVNATAFPNGTTVWRTLVFSATQKWQDVVITCSTTPTTVAISSALCLANKTQLANAIASAKAINGEFNPTAVLAIPAALYRETTDVVNSLRYDGPFMMDFLNPTLDGLMLQVVSLLKPVRGVISPYSGRVLPLIIGAFQRNSSIETNSSALDALAQFAKQIATATPWLNAKPAVAPAGANSSVSSPHLKTCGGVTMASIFAASLQLLNRLTLAGCGEW